MFKYTSNEISRIANNSNFNKNTTEKVMHSDINAIVINDEIIWYGSINPFCWSKKDDTILRIVDSEYVKDIFSTK